MKNNQKGFIVPLVIAIVVIAVGAGLYFYNNKKVDEPQTSASKETINTNNTATKKFTDPTGLYTLTFASDFLAKQIATTTFNFSKADDTAGNNLLNFATVKGTITDYEAFLEKIAKNAIIKREKINFSNLLVDKYQFNVENEPAAKAFAYIIPVTFEKTSGLIIVTISSKTGSDKWLNDGDAIIKSISIDPSKVNLISVK